MTRRLTPYPPRLASRAVLGYNSNSKLTKAAVQAAKDGGATVMRVNPGWDTVETWKDGGGGALALSASSENFLTYCSEVGIEPMLVASYGPPRSTVKELTLSADVAIGSTVLPTGSTTGVLGRTTDFAQKMDGTQIVADGRWAYYGALVDAVGGSSVTLAAKTSIALKKNEVIRIQRLAYPPLYTKSKTDPSVVAFMRYAKFLAERIAAHGLKGTVCLWNEDTWAHDTWNRGYLFFDSKPAEVEEATRLRSILEAALEATLPTGVTFINGASDKSESSSLISQFNPTVEQVSGRFYGDGMHDYGDNPEQTAWDPGDAFTVVNTEDASANFPGMERKHLEKGLPLRSVSTECGSNISNETRQAVHSLRRVASHFGMDVPSVIYSLADANDNFPLMSSTLVPRAAYTALQRLMGLVAGLGADGGRSVAIPTLIACAQPTWPLMTSALYGVNGGLLLVWQRTYRTAPGAWSSIPTPATYPATFWLDARYKVKEALNVRTGAAVVPEVSGRAVTIPGVSEDVIALRTEPA